MTSRTGVPTLLKVAQRLCQLVNDYGPVIAVRYPTNAALLAALAAASAACAVLRDELAQVREYGD